MPPDKKKNQLLDGKHQHDQNFVPKSIYLNLPFHLNLYLFIVLVCPFRLSLYLFI
jgi:hypothetical protein